MLSSVTFNSNCSQVPDSDNVQLLENRESPNIKSIFGVQCEDNGLSASVTKVPDVEVQEKVTKQNDCNTSEVFSNNDNKRITEISSHEEREEANPFKPESPRQRRQEPTSSIKSKAPETQKKQRGRPRLYRKDLPYKIGKDELKCRECDEEFLNSRTLRVHYNTHFPNHVCDVCSKGFVKLGSLKKHMKSHDVGPFACEICQKVFNNYNTLQSHRRYSHTTLPFRCRECSEGFQTLQRLFHHMATSHGRTDKRYKCRYCEKGFKCSGDRSKHVSQWHEPRLVCPVCAKLYTHNYMNAHIHTHEHERTGSGGDGGGGGGNGDALVCVVCDAVRPQRLMAKHITGHRMRNRYTCKLCSAAFSQKSSLLRHIETHSCRGELNGVGSLQDLVHDTASGGIDNYCGILPPLSPLEPGSPESHSTELDSDVLSVGDIDQALLEDDLSLPSDWDI